MGFRIKHIFQWNVRQPKPSYTAMVLILTSALSVVSITVTLILSVLKNFKTNECVTIFTVAFTIIGTFLGMMLVILRKMRETYPLNIIMLILYGACISVAQGYSVINACVLVKVGAWAIAFVLLSILVPIGMVIKTDLSEHTSALIIYCAAELFITTVVFTGLMIADHKKLAIGFGQLTFGTNLSYTFNPDYCIAALTLFTTLLGFFVTSSVEVHFIEGLIKNKLL
uniref:Bax inhibitor 1-related n=1 Tax=Schistosoma mansoni TaxID=6183 RepID=A0A3Q0KKB0_SCHMA